MDWKAKLFTPGELVGPYMVDALLGTGGAGAVYRVTDDGDKVFALKTSRFDLGDMSIEDREDCTARFRQEFNALNQLGPHAYLVPVYAFGWHERAPFFTMDDLSAGWTLDAFAAQPRVTMFHVLDAWAKTAEAVAYLHQKSVLHRDLKPSNVFVVNGKPQLVDFGAVKVPLADSLTREGSVLGTFDYVSPQCLLHVLDGAHFRPTAADDVFALGLILYRLLTGGPAFRQRYAPRRVVEMRSGPPHPCELNPKAPPSMAELALQLLAFDLDKRPVDARAVLTLLGPAMKAAQGMSFYAAPQAITEPVHPMEDSPEAHGRRRVTAPLLRLVQGDGAAEPAQVEPQKADAPPSVERPAHPSSIALALADSTLSLAERVSGAEVWQTETLAVRGQQRGVGRAALAAVAILALAGLYRVTDYVTMRKPSIPTPEASVALADSPAAGRLSLLPSTGLGLILPPSALLPGPEKGNAPVLASIAPKSRPSAARRALQRCAAGLLVGGLACTTPTAATRPGSGSAVRAGTLDDQTFMERCSEEALRTTREIGLSDAHFYSLWFTFPTMRRDRTPLFVREGPVSAKWESQRGKIVPAEAEAKLEGAVLLGTARIRPEEHKLSVQFDRLKLRDGSEHPFCAVAFQAFDSKAGPGLQEFPNLASYTEEEIATLKDLRPGEFPIGTDSQWIRVR